MFRYFSLAYLCSRYGLATFAVLRSHWPLVAFVAALLAAATLVMLQIAERTDATADSVASA